jgi:flavin reductase (DIM6/NTAB) family NADH-FMN oxidoreductase RutF
MEIIPDQFKGFHNVLRAVVVPRPIAFVSTTSESGQVNLAPFSFYNAVCYKPAMLAISVAKRLPSGRIKDTYANIQANGEFVVNLVSEAIAAQMVQTAAEYGPECDEFELTGLTPAPSTSVRPPHVAESPVSMECVLDQMVPLGEGRTETGLFLGCIQRLHIRDELIDGYHVDIEALKAVGRLGGREYCVAKDLFEMTPPAVDAE